MWEGSSALILNRRPEVFDQFGRTVASGWGTAPTGQTWANSNTAVMSVGSGKGALFPAANASAMAALVQPSADVEVAAVVDIAQTQVGGATQGYIQARASDPNSGGANRYQVRAEFGTGGVVTVTLLAIASNPVLINAAAYTPGTGINLRLRVVGSTVMGKAWIVGQAEPAWTSVVDTSLTAAGYVRLHCFRASGNTTPDPSVLFDNFSVRALYPNVWDDFARTVGAGGWGAANSGHGYTLTGTAADFSVSGGLGRIAPNVTNTSRSARVDFPHMDADLVCDVGAVEAQTGASTPAFMWLRGNTGQTTNYRVTITFLTNGNVSFTLAKTVNSVQTNLVANFVVLTYSPGEMFRVRFQCVGSTLRAKAWRVADPEPSSWQGTTTDTDVASGVGPTLQVFRNTGNTNTDPTILFDNFFVRQTRPAINDAFGRTVASGWGNLTSGQAWVNSDTAVMSVGSGKGVMSPAANTAVAASLPAPSADVEVRAVVDVAQTQTGNDTVARIFARASTSGGGDRYQVQAAFNSSGQVTVLLVSQISGGGTLATLLSGTAYTPGTGVNLRLRCVGQKIMGKAWIVGQAEPAWTEVQNTQMTVTGFVACNTFRLTGNTSVNPNVTYDDFQVIDLSRPLRVSNDHTNIGPARLVA